MAGSPPARPDAQPNDAAPPQGPAPSAALSQEERAAARRQREREKHARYAAERAAGTRPPKKTAQQAREAAAARTGKPVLPKPKIGHPPKINVAMVAEALARTGGLVGVAAQYLKVERRTVNRYLARYASLQKVREQAREEALDHTEWALIKAARAGEPWAVQWFLRYQGRSRGYQDVRKTEQEATVRVEVAYTEDALSSGQPVTVVSQLPAPDADDGSADSPRIEIVEAEVTYPQEAGAPAAPEAVE